MKLKHILLSLYGVFLLSTILYAEDIHELCQESNLELAENLSGLVQGFLGVVLNLIPLLLEHKFVDPALLGLYLKIGSKVKLIKLLFYVVLTGYLNSLLKSIYSLPRPFVEFPDDIENMKCSYSLGAPSDYGMSGFVIYVSGYWLYIRDFQTDIIPEEVVKWIKRIYVGLAFLVVTLGCLSRIAMGLHSYDQIILGLLYGVFFQFAYMNFLDPYLEYAIKYIIIRRHTRRSWILYVLLYSLVISLLLSTGIYLLKRTDPVYAEYYDVIKERCDPDEWVFMENHYLSTFRIAALIAFFAGITLLPHKYPTIYEESLKKGLIRFILYWSSVFGFSRLFSSDFTDVIWAQGFLIETPYYLIIGINASLIFPNIFKYIRLQNESDFLENEYSDEQIILRKDFE